MARARNIKPGFFKNEILAEMEISHRLLFVGLWTLADREGRIEDRPKRIKLELFPWDSFDIDEGLSELAKAGFIERYEADGKKVIAILSFLKHQTPHGTEKDSDLPEKDGSYTVHERTPNGYVTGKKRGNNVNPEKNNVKPEENNVHPPLPNSATPVNPPLEPVNPLLDNTLNPDLLNPDLLNPESGAAKPAPAARGTRLPVDWKLPEDWKTEAQKIRAEWHDQHIQRVADMFRDHWIAQPGQKGVKTDWRATWRNWCRRDTTQMYPGPQASTGQAGHGGRPVNGQPYDPRQDPSWRPKPMPRPGQRTQPPAGDKP